MLVMVVTHTMHMMSVSIATIVKECIKMTLNIPHNEYQDEEMVKEQAMKNAMMIILTIQMDEMKIDHKSKSHGCAMEELRQQEMYVNTVMLLLVGIQTTKLFLKYV